MECMEYMEYTKGNVEDRLGTLNYGMYGNIWKVFGILVQFALTD
jgi:hypothetical protein